MSNLETTGDSLAAHLRRNKVEYNLGHVPWFYVHGRILSKKCAEGQALLKWHISQWNNLALSKGKLKNLKNYLKYFKLGIKEFILIIQVRKLCTLSFDESTLDLSNYIIRSISFRNIVTMGGRIRVLPQDSIEIISLFYSIWTWPIKLFGRCGRFSTIRYATLLSSYSK